MMPGRRSIVKDRARVLVQRDKENMAAYLITYRLAREEQAYRGLYDYFDRTGYAVVGTSSRVIISFKSAMDIANELRAHLDANDVLYVFGLNGMWAGYPGSESERVLKWLTENVSA